MSAPVSVRVTTHGGLELVLSDTTLIRDLTKGIDELRTRYRWRHNRELPFADALLPAARRYLDLADVMVPDAEPPDDNAEVQSAPWITTAAMAQQLGITDRAVRKRIAAGTLAGRKAGGTWLVTLEGPT